MEPSTASSTSTPTELEENKFNSEKITALIKEVVDSTLTDAVYTHSKVSDWNSTIINTCITKLRTANKNRKYIVTCIILEKGKGGFYAGSSVYWDHQNDGSASYEHVAQTLHAFINVFSLSI